jgi:hypothetical protein
MKVVGAPGHPAWQSVTHTRWGDDFLITPLSSGWEGFVSQKYR